jgi:hypothetical protein
MRFFMRFLNYQGSGSPASSHPFTFVEACSLSVEAQETFVKSLDPGSTAEARRHCAAGARSFEDALVTFS